MSANQSILSGTVSSLRESDDSLISGQARRQLVSRACDRCKIREAKCSSGQPCRRCRESSSVCTYLITQRTRGPRTESSLNHRSCRNSNRSRDLNYAEEPTTSSQIRRGSLRPTLCPATPDMKERKRFRLPTYDLAAQLKLFKSRLAAIWPIVDVESVIVELRGTREVEYRALATAMIAAMLSQLKSSIRGANGPYNADLAAAECHEYCSQMSSWTSPNLNTLRIRFFLHAYYENIEPGSSASLLCLREALTLTQILGLDQEDPSDSGISDEDEHVRGAIFWLLFITERGICVLHRLPVVLHSNSVLLPTSPNLNPDFLKLVELVSMIDRAGFYIVTQKQGFTWQDYQSRKGITDLDVELKRLCLSLDGSTTAQRADINATVHWIRSAICQYLQNIYGAQPQHLLDILENADSLVSSLSSLPASAIETNGFGIQLKIFEVAKSAVSSFNRTAMVYVRPETVSLLKKILRQTFRLLSSDERGNNSLLRRFFDVVAEAYGNIASSPFKASNQWEWNHNWPLSGQETTDQRNLGTIHDLHPIFDFGDADLWGHNMSQGLQLEEESHFMDNAFIETNSSIIEFSLVQSAESDVSRPTPMDETEPISDDAPARTDLLC